MRSGTGGTATLVLNHNLTVLHELGQRGSRVRNGVPEAGADVRPIVSVRNGRENRTGRGTRQMYISDRSRTGPGREASGARMVRLVAEGVGFSRGRGATVGEDEILS